MSNDVLDPEDGVDDDIELQDESTGDMIKPFNPNDIDIVVEPKSLDILIERMRYDGIDMDTDFQRHPDLWDNQKMSRLIESILIRFPLPAFYFDASDVDKWLIVDGLQRLSSIRKFVIDKKLHLTNLEFMTDLQGKSYKTLPSNLQRRIRECPITVYLIKPSTPDAVKQSIFRRINTGGLVLNNQEIRNAMAKPEDRELLQQAAQHELMVAMMSDLSRRMRDQELILRFWAFYQFDYFEPGNKKVFSAFLDKAMNDIKSWNNDSREAFKHIFDMAISRCFELLGEMAFQKDVKSTTKRLKNRSLFEVWMVTLAKLEESDFKELLSAKYRFREAAQKLLVDEAFYKSISHSTQTSEHVRIRYQKVKHLIRSFNHA